MDKEEFIKKLKEFKGVICLSQFGSFGSEYWNKGRSDIDIAVITEPHITFLDTLDMEDKIEELCKKYYSYDNVHLTFILFKEFHNKFARIAIDSDKVFVVDENKWFDFTHYVLKFIRNNERLESQLKIDEEYSYFGRNVHE